MSSQPSPNADPKSALDAAFGTGTTASTPEKAQDEYRVRIPNFEGPLDLLLHLIRKDQLNIYDIPIARICKSYLQHLEVMIDPDMNIAGEFMVMAATLTYMKSLWLMPRDETVEVVDDPRAPLVAQLIEYERFKRAAEKLDGLDWMNRDLYPRPTITSDALIPVESLIDAPLEAVDSFQLLLCLKVALNRTTRRPHVVQSDPISIRDKVVQLTQLLEEQEVVEFVRLLPEVIRITDVIVAFFATLELARLKFVEIIQHENFGPIYIRAVRPLRELNTGLLDQF